MTREEALVKTKIAKYKKQIGSELADVIIEALEKQIPKKPHKYKVKLFGEDNGFAYGCPSCEYCFTLKGAFDNRNRHCDICGQAIDWSGEE